MRIEALSTRLTQVAAYQQTICRVREADSLLRRINDLDEPVLARARQAAAAMIAGLHRADFEALVDLIFARSGWQRRSAAPIGTHPSEFPPPRQRAGPPARAGGATEISRRSSAPAGVCRFAGEKAAPVRRLVPVVRRREQERGKSGSMSGVDVTGSRVLVAEDESLVVLDLQAILAQLGCGVVGPAFEVRTALELVRRERIDFAILDIQLRGETVFPVAHALVRRAIPFVFATGRDRADIPAAFQNRPCLSKPFSAAMLRQQLEQLVS